MFPVFVPPRYYVFLNLIAKSNFGVEISSFGIMSEIGEFFNNKIKNLINITLLEQN